MVVPWDREGCLGFFVFSSMCSMVSRRVRPTEVLQEQQLEALQTPDWIQASATVPITKSCRLSSPGYKSTLTTKWNASLAKLLGML